MRINVKMDYSEIKFSTDPNVDEFDKLTHTIRVMSRSDYVIAKLVIDCMVRLTEKSFRKVDHYLISGNNKQLINMFTKPDFRKDLKPRSIQDERALKDVDAVLKNKLNKVKFTQNEKEK